MQKEQKSNWFQRNNISFAILFSLLAMVGLIIDIFYFQYKVPLTFGLVFPLLLVVIVLMGWNTFMSLKNLEWDWSDKRIYLHISYPLFIILVIIASSLIEYSWSNLFFIIVVGVYFVYLGISYNFYIAQVSQYLEGKSVSKNDKKK